jgi:hypothetical protein
VKHFDRRTELIRARFPARTLLTHQELCELFPEHGVGELTELFDLIEREFHLDLGFLRREDSLHALFAPVRSFNPVWWAIYRGLESDGLNEISARLRKRRAERGLPELSRDELRSFGDLVRAWCERDLGAKKA